MFDDIIGEKKVGIFDTIPPEGSNPNRKIVCPGCGVTVITIEENLGTLKDDGDWDIQYWDYECRQCTENVIKCSGGCGKKETFKKTKVSLTVKWTCKECCDKEWDKYD